MEHQTIILLVIGLLTICAMVYFIIRGDPSSANKTNANKTSTVRQPNQGDIQESNQPEEVFDEESNYTTVNDSDGAEESIFDS